MGNKQSQFLHQQRPQHLAGHLDAPKKGRSVAQQVSGNSKFEQYLKQQLSQSASQSDISKLEITPSKSQQSLMNSPSVSSQKNPMTEGKHHQMDPRALQNPMAMHRSPASCSPQKRVLLQQRQSGSVLKSKEISPFLEPIVGRPGSAHGSPVKKKF